MANISESREQNKFICSAEAQAEQAESSPIQFPLYLETKLPPFLPVLATHEARQINDFSVSIHIPVIVVLSFSRRQFKQFASTEVFSMVKLLTHLLTQSAGTRV